MEEKKMNAFEGETEVSEHTHQEEDMASCDEHEHEHHHHHHDEGDCCEHDHDHEDHHHHHDGDKDDCCGHDHEHEHHHHHHHHDDEDDCCGHDHEHEHHHHHHDDDEGDCCGHDHEHHHHHDDEEDDCCGHDHEHEHHHHHHHHDEEDDCCGHDHEHEHHHHHHHDDDDDCCGHDHEHEHHHHHHHDDDDEEDCCCGHDHEHEHHHHHHHDDEDDCCCGHDHEHHHHHHHDDDCCCGHDHHHHHHHHDDDDDDDDIVYSEEHNQALRTLNDSNSQVFLLQNLGCAHCAAKMEERINALPAVNAAVITFATKQLRVSADHPEELLSDIEKICTSIESEVKVVLKENTHQKELAAAKAREEEEKKEQKKELTSIIIGAVLFAVGVIFNHVGLDGVPAFIVFLIAYIILGGKVLVQSAKNISHGQVFDENFLMSVATIGAFCIQEFPEAAGVMLFFRIGDFFEEKAVEKSRKQIMTAVDMRPETVNRFEHGELSEIPAEEAEVGDLLLIRPGDRIPLDSVIVEGESRIDTSPITGEPVPLSVRAGDSITSGCVNTDGQLTVRVEKILSESMVSRILESVENAAASKPKIDRFITRFAKIYTPCVVFGALAVAIIPSLVSGNWYYWIYTALTFLVMSCPCALVLSVPLAFFSGIGAGSKSGILFKGGLSMESLSKIGAVVMDKTGTITEGNFKLQSVVTAGEIPENDLLALCAGCESNSTHPIAQSIVCAARERGLEIVAPHSLKEIAGCGIAAETTRGTVLCGNRKLLEQYGVSIPELADKSYGAEIFAAVDGKFAGHLVISDTLKADAKSSIEKLKSLGLHTVMLTGDSENSAQAIAMATGIDEVHAKLLPQDKLALLSDIRKGHGAVMFVGDGINDAPVLAGADVGAAMGSGADAAIEAADAVFMTAEVESIPHSIRIARFTNNIAVQNVVFALAVKLFVMILGLTGHANMWMAVFADTGVAMICVLNSIRALFIK